QHLAGLDGLGRERADALALLDMLAVAFGKRRLGAEGPGGSTAIGAAQHALLAELVEVAPDGLGRDAEAAGQIGDSDRRGGAQRGRDARLPLGLAKLLARRHGPLQRAASSAAASSAKPSAPRACATHLGLWPRRSAKSRTLATPTDCGK